MRNNNHKKNMSNYLKIIDESLNDSDEYNYYNLLYNSIKERYLEKIKNQELDIKVEKIRLKSKSGGYSGSVTSFSVNLIILALTIFMTGFIQAYSVSDYKYKFAVIIAISIAFYIIILNVISKDALKRKDYISAICLDVLDNIEHEMKYVANSQIANDEVAATIETDESSKQVKPSSNQTNGNWNVEINMLSVLDVVGAIYKAGKIAKKMFRKKK
ncbi:hypothetical protein HMPREF1982_03393 [Clostridiales bacterium oral taxon 876 str. F0540]|nr:hypothetical protein HMPREF1982_03393 [Clostridiales bacterium oral taxon 876 str. F0540]